MTFHGFKRCPEKRVQKDTALPGSRTTPKYDPKKDIDHLLPESWQQLAHKWIRGCNSHFYLTVFLEFLAFQAHAYAPKVTSKAKLSGPKMRQQRRKGLITNRFLTLIKFLTRVTIQNKFWR
jgi:hypothetical protein